jgi:hypothetical protein
LPSGQWGGGEEMPDAVRAVCGFCCPVCCPGSSYAFAALVAEAFPPVWLNRVLVPIHIVAQPFAKSQSERGRHMSMGLKFAQIRPH